MIVLYVAMADSLMVVRGDGQHIWESNIALSQKQFRCVAVDPGRDSTVFCGTAESGVWRSRDLGVSWSPANSNLEHLHVTALAVSTAEDGQEGSNLIYLGTEPSSIFRSDCGGEDWKKLGGLTELPSAESWSFPPRPETHHVRWIAPHSLFAGRLFVAIEAGALVRSLNGGKTWIDRVPGGPRDTHTLRVHPGSPDRLYSAAGDGYFESTDGGETWTKPEAGLRHHYIWGCVVNPLDVEQVVISAAKTASSAHSQRNPESWLYRKKAGHPWTAVREGLPDPVGTTISALATHPKEPQTIYAANNRGIFRSQDMGAAWHQLAVQWPGRFLVQRVAGLAVASVG